MKAAFRAPPRARASPHRRSHAEWEWKPPWQTNRGRRRSCSYVGAATNRAQMNYGVERQLRRQRMSALQQNRWTATGRLRKFGDPHRIATLSMVSSCFLSVADGTSDSDTTSYNGTCNLQSQ